MAERVYKVVSYAHLNHQTHGHVMEYRIRATDSDTAYGRAFELTRAFFGEFPAYYYTRSVGALRKERVWLSKTDAELVGMQAQYG